MLGNKVSGTIDSKRYGKTKFLAFYQPYQVQEIFLSTHNEINERISTIKYAFDVSSEYDALGKVFLNASKAEILFLALGSPKEEKWFATYKNQLQYVRVVQGVGGTLDTIAGTVKRAPVIWRKLSVEWPYRLISEPKRIKWQKVLPIFAAMVLFNMMKSYFKSGYG